ncbi:MAG: hypothetical protein N3C12_00955 [Candidatus Binatia bacterium]|nr:hypothetical protein [Candidatus Binatia bacterium]
MGQIGEELARPFDNDAVRQAIRYCVERDAEFVADYVAENLELVPE